MNIKAIFCVASATLSTSLMATDTPEVSNVVMAQANFGRKLSSKLGLEKLKLEAVRLIDLYGLP